MKCSAALSIVMAFWLAGCVFRSKQQAKVTTPPPPQPVAAAPSPPPQPLSIPQTQVQLPAPQKISPEAEATTQLPPSSPETETSDTVQSRTQRRPAGPVAGPKPETAAPAGSSAQQAAGVTTPPPGGAPAESETRGPVQEIVPAPEVKRLQDSVAARKQEIRKVLDAADKRRLNREQSSVVLRIQSFLQQSDEAEKRNDWRQADALAERAQVLAKELSSGNQ
jgi:hypothetical protein